MRTVLPAGLAVGAPGIFTRIILMEKRKSVRSTWSTWKNTARTGRYTKEISEMVSAPDIVSSTIEERRTYIKERYPCISDCDMCGLCKVFHGKDAETAYKNYIDGNKSFLEVSAYYK